MTEILSKLIRTSVHVLKSKASMFRGLISKNLAHYEGYSTLALAEFNCTNDCLTNFIFVFESPILCNNFLDLLAYGVYLILFE